MSGRYASHWNAFLLQIVSAAHNKNYLSTCVPLLSCPFSGSSHTGFASMDIYVCSVDIS